MAKLTIDRSFMKVAYISNGDGNSARHSFLIEATSPLEVNETRDAERLELVIVGDWEFADFLANMRDIAEKLGVKAASEPARQRRRSRKEVV